MLTSLLGHSSIWQGVFCEQPPSRPDLRYVVAKSSHHVGVTVITYHGNRSGALLAWDREQFFVLVFFAYRESHWTGIVICRNNLLSLSACQLNRTVCCSLKRSVVQVSIRTSVCVRELAGIFIQVSEERTCHAVYADIVCCHLHWWILFCRSCSFLGWC